MAYELLSLPEELLVEIIEILYSKWSYKVLLAPSLVCRRLRGLCLPRIFENIRVDFTTSGFEKLSQISESPVAPCVREINYHAQLLLDSALLDNDPVIPELKAAFQDQKNILEQNMDYITLASTMPRLSSIQSFKLHLDAWLASLRELIRHSDMVVDVIISSQRHISASLEALTRARKADIAIQKFSVEGLYLVQNVTSPDQRSINDVSLSDISELRFQCDSINYYLKSNDPHPLGGGYRLLTESASSTLQLLSLDFVDEDSPIRDPISESCLFVTICSGLVFPRLRFLSLSNFVLPLKLFEQFSRNHAERNLVLSLSNLEIWFPPEASEGSDTLILGDAEIPSESLLQCLAGIGNVANFKAVTISADRPKWQGPTGWHLNTAPLEKLLMREIKWRDVTPAMLVIRH